jgi:hypothetical protein
MKRRWLHWIMISCALGTGTALADAPKPYPQFTHKTVGLPSSGGSRITVQIDPAEQAAALAVDGQGEGANTSGTGTGAVAAEIAALSGGYGWFWGQVGASVEEAGPATYHKAMKALAGNVGAVPAPRLQHLQEIAAAHGKDILLASLESGVSPALILSVISVESAGRVEAESHAGAQGLMQLIPATAERFGVEDTSDAAQNIKGGSAYLAWLLETFKQDPVLALAGYNAGEGAVREHGGVPPFAEARAYVPKVLAAWEVARGLCLTPPELISDGCVFHVKGPNPDG